MILAIPESDLLASVQGRLLGVMGAAFTCLMLPILWGLWVGTRLSNRVQGLAEAADQLGAGDLPDLPAQDVSEFQRLGQALRQAHRDIQERNTLQQQLQHSQRLETLGTLAGGIAHDVNNHLSAILGHTFMVRESLPAEHPTQGRLAQVEEAANSCAKTTRTLLAFSRHGHSDLQPLDLNSLLEEMSLLFNSLLGGLVRVDLDLDPAPARIRGDRLQLEQVLMNLAVNARDAMPDGGILTFQTRHAGGTLLLRVEDNGTGMEPETLSRIFEPFFTTKPVGKGTGLGLAMVHGILQSHRGRVEVESRVGKGTTFTLSFPGDGSAPQLPVLAAQPLDTRGALANLHILVAEDESYLRETLEQALVMVGARVVSAASGSEAWEYFQDHAFDCVLSDQRMPGCTGMDLLRQIRASGRETPFILASGQDLEPFRAELSQDPALRLLPKPFSIAGLIELIEGFGIAPRAC
jgi:signal transduction histidine kinase/CheY-like chemotaxis protein